MNLLFTPIKIGNMTVKNRFVRSATHDWLGNEDGTISLAEIDLYRELAKGATGLIITAHGYISHPLGRGSMRQNGIYHDRHISGYRHLAAAVHEYDAKLVVQISHAGRQTTLDLTEGQTPIAPSAITDRTVNITPIAMTEDDIWQLIDDFVSAIERVKMAGCDGVQLHIAHGYGLSQFLSPYTNRRNDEWGGSIENRTRILTEIITRAKVRVGEDFPILVKLNSTDGFTGPEYLSLADAVYAAMLLEKLGIAAIEVSGGIRESKGVMSRPGIRDLDDEAYFAPAARAIKAVVSIPVILVGGLRTTAKMNALIEDGTTDMVSLSRPFIKEPDLVSRIEGGQKKVSCISCNACFNPAGLACHHLPRT